MLRLGIPVTVTVRMTVKLGRYEHIIKLDNDLPKLFMVEWEYGAFEGYRASAKSKLICLSKSARSSIAIGLGGRR